MIFSGGSILGISNTPSKNAVCTNSKLKPSSKLFFIIDIILSENLNNDLRIKSSYTARSLTSCPYERKKRGRRQCLDFLKIKTLSTIAPLESVL